MAHLSAVPVPAEPDTAEPEESESEPELTEPEPEIAAPEAPEPPTNGDVPRAAEPVLDMLAERDQEERRQRLRTPLLWALAGGLGAIGLFGAGYVGATWFGDDGGAERASGGDDGGAQRFLPNPGGPAAAEPFPSDPRDASCYPTAAVTRAVTLHQRPGSKRTLKVQGRTEWGSARVFSIVKRRGDWLAVLAPELRNDEVGWMRAKGAKLDCVRWSLHVDLSRAASQRPQGRQDDAQDDDRDRRQGPSHPEGPLRGHGQAQGGRQGVAVRVLRPRADWSPDAAARRTGPAATGWPCTPPATVAASASR